MSDLFPRPATKAAPSSPAEQRRQRAQAGHAAIASAFASRGKAAPETFRSSLGTFGLGTGAAAAPAPEQARKSAIDTLPAPVREAARKHCLSEPSAQLLALVAEKSAATGGPVTFTRNEVAQHLRLSAEAAGTVVDGLEARGLLRKRYSSAGAPIGYSVDLGA